MSGDNKARFECLHSFIKFSNYKHRITKIPAAERKKIYRNIQALEESMGLSKGGLIQHPRGSNPRLTELGSKFLPEAKRLTRTIDEWKEQVQFYEKNKSGRISIGIRGSHWNLLKKWFLEVSSLLGTHMDLELKANYPEVLGSMLDDKSLDLCVIYEGHGPAEGYNSTPISTQDLLFFVRLPEGITESDNLSIGELKDISRKLNYIYIDKDQNFKNLHDQKMNDPYFRFPAIRFTDTSIAIDYFVSDFGIGSCGFFPDRSRVDIEAELDRKRAKKSLKIVDGLKISRKLELYYRAENTNIDDQPFSSEDDIRRVLEDSHLGTLTNENRYKVISHISKKLISHIKVSSPEPIG